MSILLYITNWGFKILRFILKVEKGLKRLRFKNSDILLQCLKQMYKVAAVNLFTMYL